jgi:hypothetical protein
VKSRRQSERATNQDENKGHDIRTPDATSTQASLVLELLTLAARIAASSSHKRSQLFIRAHNETLSVVAVGVNNPHRSPLGINRGDAAPTPTGFAEFVGT